MRKLLPVFVSYLRRRSMHRIVRAIIQAKKTIPMTIYNREGEESGRMVYNLSGVSGSSSIAAATINSEMFDKKENHGKNNKQYQMRKWHYDDGHENDDAAATIGSNLKMQARLPVMFILNILHL